MSIRIHLTGQPEAVGVVLEQLRNQGISVLSDETTFWVLAPSRKSRDVRETVVSKRIYSFADYGLLQVCAAIYPGLCWEITDVRNKRLPEEHPCGMHGNYVEGVNSWDQYEEWASFTPSFSALKKRWENLWNECHLINGPAFAPAVGSAFIIVYAAESAQEAKDTLDFLIRDIDAPSNEDYEVIKGVYEDIRAAINRCLPD